MPGKRHLRACATALCLVVLAASGPTYAALPAPVWQAGPGGEIQGVALSPDGRYLAVADGVTTQIWDVAARELRRVLPGGGPLAWSRDGARVAVGGSGVRLWKMPEATLLRFDPAAAGGVSFSLDGTRLACGERGTWQSALARIYASADGRLLTRITPPEDGDWHGYPRPALSPDGRRVVTYRALDFGSDRDDRERALLWDTAAVRPLRAFRDTRSVWSAAFSPDGEWLALGGADNRLTLWNTRDGSTRRLWDSGDSGMISPVRDVRFSHDGRNVLAGGDRTLRTWTVADGLAHPPIPLPPGCDTYYMAADDALRTLAVRSFSRGVAVVDGAGRLLWELPPAPPAIDRITWSSDGSLLAHAAGGRLRLWDWRGGKLRAAPSVLGNVNGLRVSGDTLTAVLSRDEDDIRRVDLWTWNGRDGLLRDARFLPSAGGRQALSPGGRWLADVWPYAQSIPLFDASQGRVARKLKLTDQLMSVAFADDTLLATAERDETIRLWNLPSGAARTIHVHALGNDFEARVLAVAPGGRYVAGGVEEVRLWDASPARERVLPVGGKGVTALAFSRDAALLAAGTDDGAVHLWRLSATATSLRPGKHGGAVRSLAFSPDGRFLASGATDGTLKIWEVAHAPRGQVTLRLTLWNSGNDDAWLAAAPGGAFTASANADSLARWSASGSIGEPLPPLASRAAARRDDLLRLR